MQASGSPFKSCDISEQIEEEKPANVNPALLKV
jgi:hypothetical protein